MRESVKILLFILAIAAASTGIGMGVEAYFNQMSYDALQVELDDANAAKDAAEQQAQAELSASRLALKAAEELRQQLADIPAPVVPPPVVKKPIAKEKPIVVQIPPSVDSCRALPLPDDVLQRLSH